MHPIPRLARNRELDWLRAYAILLVVAEHLVLLKPYPTFWTGIVHVWYEGRTGVDLFFVISGYVISRTFVAGFDAARRDGAALACVVAFYVKRAVRLWPATAVWAGVILVAGFVFEGAGAFPSPRICAETFAAAIAYVANWSEMVRPTRIGYFYSLATEMQFYLAFPLLLAVARTPQARLVVTLGLFTLGALGCPGLDSNPDVRFSGILLGIAIACATSPASIEARRAKGPAPAWAAALFTGVLVVALATCSIPLGSDLQRASHAAAALGAILVAAAVVERGHVSAFGLPHLFDWIGTRSYSLYVCHIPILLIVASLAFDYGHRDGVLVAQPRLPDLALLAVWLVTTVAATEMTYRLVERPAQAYAHRVARHVRSGVLVLASPASA